MKRYHFSLIIIAVVLLSFSATSCRDKTQTNIVGTWKQILHTEPDNTVTFWNFYAGNELEISTISFSDTVVRIYTYNASKRDMSIFGNDSLFDVNAYTPGPNEFRGEYYIHHLGKDICQMEKVGHGVAGDYGNPYLRIELKKQ